MDRVRDLVSRQRSSPLSFSTSRSQRKAANDNVKSTTSSASPVSEPIKATTAMSSDLDSQSTQPTQSSQATAQAQPAQAQAESTGNTKAFKGGKKKNRSGTDKKIKAAEGAILMERRETDQKLFDLANAVINQNEVISDTGYELSYRINELARDIRKANKYIEAKDQEIAEINNKLKTMEVSFNEAAKSLKRAQLLASQATKNGELEECKAELKAQMHQNIKSMTKAAKTSELGSWSKEQTNAYLKDLLSTYFTNEDTVKSRRISRSVMSLAKQFIFHGNYGDEYATTLFHLANGHSYKKFLLKSQVQDHEAASCYPPNHVYRHLHEAHRTQTGKESAADIDKEVLAMFKNYSGCISHEQMMGGSLPGLLDPIPSTQLDDILAQLPKGVNKCVVPRCGCEKLEKGEFRQWVARLRTSLACKPFPRVGPVVESFTEAIESIFDAARRWRIDVILSCINDDELPVIKFLYERACYDAKTPAMVKKLQASAERFGFRLGLCEHNGKAGYHIMPAELVNGRITEAMRQKCMRERMAINKMIKEEVKSFIDHLWVDTLNKSDQARKNQVIDIMEWHASDYFVKHGSKLLEESGSTFETCTPEIAREIRSECLMAAKEALLESMTQMPLTTEDQAAYRWEELKGSKAK